MKITAHRNGPTSEPVTITRLEFWHGREFSHRVTPENFERFNQQANANNARPFVTASGALAISHPDGMPPFHIYGDFYPSSIEVQPTTNKP